jgi:hypothetical protein
VNGIVHHGIPMEEMNPMSHLPKQLRKGAMLTASLAIAVGAFAAPQVSAQSVAPPLVPVNGTVTNSGNNSPIIECAWALPDTNFNWADYMNGYRVGGVAGNDDAPNTKPQTSPCINPEIGKDGSRPAQADQLDIAKAPRHIQVTPNIDDKLNGSPMLRWIELWAAVDSTAPGTVVHWKVYHPDGSFKVQVDGSNYTPGSYQAPCDGPAGMFDMAVATGQIDGPTVRNNSPLVHDSLVDYCKQNEKDFYYGAFGLSKHQPYGTYKVEAVAVKPANGGQSILTYYLDVLPIMSLAKDFQGLNFPKMSAGQVYKIDGDTIWGGNKPTLQNQGNQGMTIQMSYTNLCILVGVPAKRDCGESKRISYFDGGLGTSIATVEHREPIPSDDDDTKARTGPAESFINQIDTNFGPRYRTLCPNDLAKVDFSVHTPFTLQQGDYSGNVHLRVFASPECPTDRGSVYDPKKINDPNVASETDFDGTTPKSNGYYGN